MTYLKNEIDLLIKDNGQNYRTQPKFLEKKKIWSIGPKQSNSGPIKALFHCITENQKNRR